MSKRIEEEAFDLDVALARLADEMQPRPALAARVLADAAMVSAERRPAAPDRERAPVRSAGISAWLSGLLSRPAYGAAGAFATLLLSLGLGLGYGFMNEREVLDAAGIDATVLSQLSPLDGIEREVVAAVDDDVFGFDAPL